MRCISHQKNEPVAAYNFLRNRTVYMDGNLIEMKKDLTVKYQCKIEKLKAIQLLVQFLKEPKKSGS
jgi:hypothetical protein